MEKLKPDVVLKDFWRDNERFASLFNAVVFQGKEVIHPESLREVDTEVSNVIELKEYRETLEKSRDVVKKTAYGVDFVILGIESQMKTHYAMPLRVMLYDALGYWKEYQEISRSNRKAGDKMTVEEFLSALRKDDRLHPIISVVVYYGEDPWDGPLSLKDMIVDMPDEIADVFSDYRMNLTQVRESSKYDFSNEDVRTVFEISECIFAEKFDEIQKKYGNRDIKAELAIVIGTITESTHIINQAAEQKGGFINMCSALEKLEKRGIEQGIQRGIERGIEQGIEQGIKQERKEIIVQMLRKGMDQGLIKEITGVDEATIEELRKETLM